MSEVSWVLVVEVKTDRRTEFDALVLEMIESTRQEPGAIAYEWFVGDDGRTVHAYERYADSDATLTHLGTFGEKFAARLLDMAEPQSIVVYGSPDDRVREGLAAFGPTYFAPLAGFGPGIAG